MAPPVLLPCGLLHRLRSRSRRGRPRSRPCWIDCDITRLSQGHASRADTPTKNFVPVTLSLTVRWRIADGGGCCRLELRILRTANTAIPHNNIGLLPASTPDFCEKARTTSRSLAAQGPRTSLPVSICLNRLIYATPLYITMAWLAGWFIFLGVAFFGLRKPVARKTQSWEHALLHATSYELQL